MSTERQVLRALGSISAATLASRVLGFVRDMVVARVFGAGPATDAFFVAFRIPNILRRLLAEGALSTAVIPVFVEYVERQPRAEVARMLRSLLGASLLALGLTTLAGIAAAPWIVPVIAPGFVGEAGQLALTVLLTRAMFPYLVLVGLAALAMGALNARGRFFAPALGPAILNVGMIAAVLGLAPWLDPGVLALAVGVLAGGVGQLAVQLPELRAAGLLVTPSLELAHPALGRIARLLLPAVFGLAAVQVSVFVNTLLASLLRPGSVSFLYYADRVMEFPLGVFGIALASAALPAMSRQAAAGDLRGVAVTLGFALRLAFFVAAPATVALVLLRVPIVHALFERGRFGPADTVATAEALAWYALGLVALSGARIAAQAFYALGEPGQAVRLGALSVAVNLAAALGLMGPLAHGGLALAASVGAWANVTMLLLAARRRMGPLGGRALAASAARTAGACVPLALWCAALAWLWPVAAAVWVDVAWLAVATGGGVAIFWIAGGLLRAPEREEVRRALSRGRGR